MDTAKFTALFLQEMTDNCTALSQLMIALEKTPNDTELLQEIMRISHSSKSLTKTMEYTSTSDLFHALEDVFDAARQGSGQIDSAMVDLCLAALDRIEASLEQMKENGTERDCADIAAAVRKAAAGGPQQTVTPAEKQTDALAKQPAVSHVRVDTSKLDALTNLTGELSLLYQQFAVFKQHAALRSATEPLLEQFNRLLDELRFMTTEIRLVPFEQACMQLPRLVRDLAKDAKKLIRLDIVGADIDLDKTLVDHLSAPLMHLLRNAVDHGIELPAERKAAGKEEEGVICIRTERQQGYVIVTVEDDGRPIDLATLQDCARTRGFAAHEIDAFTEDSVLDLLCDPRFSSKTEVTEISGRGIGLSAVRKTVRSLGGQLLLRQDNGRKQFVLQLPLHLSIVQALLVESCAQRYALPFVHIQRLLTLPKAAIKTTLGQPAAVIDGEDVPLIDLGTTFGNHQPATNASSVHVILINYDGGTTGIIVDDILGNDEIMIKPISDTVKHAEFFSGSTILGDGQVALIIDLLHLVDVRKSLSSHG